MGLCAGDAAQRRSEESELRLVRDVRHRHPRLDGSLVPWFYIVAKQRVVRKALSSQAVFDEDDGWQRARITVRLENG